MAHFYINQLFFVSDETNSHLQTISFSVESDCYHFLNTEKCPYVASCFGSLYCPHSEFGQKLNILFMEPVEGETLTQERFDAKPKHEQERIEAALWEVYTDLRMKYRIIHNDARWENLIWNTTTGKIIIIDLESMRQQAPNERLMPIDYEIEIIKGE